MESGEYSGDSVQLAEELVGENFFSRFEDVIVFKSGMAFDPTKRVNVFTVIFMPLFVVVCIFILAYKMSYDENMTFNWRLWINRLTGRSQFIFAQFENADYSDGRITISHAPISSSTVNLAECNEEDEDGYQELDAGIEMTEGGPESKPAKDALDEVVETISSATESASLISVDM